MSPEIGLESEDPPIPYRAYLASALTGLSGESRELVISAHTEIRRACTSLGMTVYDPMEHTDPINFSEVSAGDVFLADRREVLSSDVLLALITEPSFGEGMELELARSTLLPVLLIVDGDKSLSKMVLGAPGVKHTVRFSDPSELFTAVVSGLRTLNPKLVERRLLVKQALTNVVGRNIRRLRDSVGMSVTELAQTVGTTEEDIEFYEGNPDFVTNLGVPTLRRIAVALEVDASELLSEPERASSEVATADSVQSEGLTVFGRKAESISDRDRQTILRFLASRRVTSD
jgi:transcriptional regulator with XRE-family HTH domain